MKEENKWHCLLLFIGEYVPIFHCLSGLKGVKIGAKKAKISLTSKIKWVDRLLGWSLDHWNEKEEPEGKARCDHRNNISYQDRR